MLVFSEVSTKKLACNPKRLISGKLFQWPVLFFFTLFCAVQADGQVRAVFVYDFNTGTLDSLVNIEYDTSVQAEHTEFYTGSFNEEFEHLENELPFTNSYFNLFNSRERAALKFDINNYPIRTNVKVVGYREGEEALEGSGTLISRKHVLTSAYPIFLPDSDILQKDSYSVFPAYDNGELSAEFNGAAVSKVYYFKDFTLTGGGNIVVLELEEDIGSKAGWLSIGFNKDLSALSDEIYHKFSYPGGSQTLTRYNGDTLRYSFGVFNVVRDDLMTLIHWGGTPGGVGSSVFQVENELSYIIYGVMDFAIQNTQQYTHSRIKNWMFYAIKEIIKNDLYIETIPEETNEDIIVYPNPTFATVALKNISSRHIIKHWSIVDIWGEKVMSGRTYAPGMEIDLSKLPAGSYYLKIEKRADIENHKIIKL